MDEEVRGRWIYLCVWLGLWFQTLAPRFWMTPALSRFIHPHSIRIQFDSRDWVKWQSVLHHLALTCQWATLSFFFSTGEERVNFFGPWNVIQIIVSATAQLLVSYKGLLHNHWGNNMRRDCGMKCNCEIFRSSMKNKHDYLCWLK